MKQRAGHDPLKRPAPPDELPAILERPWQRRTIYAVASLADVSADLAGAALNRGLSCVRSAHARAKILAAARHVGIEPIETGKARPIDDAPARVS